MMDMHYTVSFCWTLNFQPLCRFFSVYLPIFFLFRLPITKVCSVLNLTIANSAKCLYTIRVQSVCTFVDYTVILRIPILPFCTHIFGNNYVLCVT